MTNDSHMIEQGTLRRGPDKTPSVKPGLGNSKIDQINPQSAADTRIEDLRTELARETQGIVIVGGGVIGNSLAAKLAEEGFNPTIISRTEPEQGLDIRPSAPIIKKQTADKLGIDFDIDSAVKAISTAKEGQGVLGKLVSRGSKMHFRKYPYTAIDIGSAASDLQRKNYEDSRINIVQGKFTDVVIDGNKVTAVKVDTDNGEETIPTRLVIDATGRTAAVARQVERVLPGSIEESRLEGAPNQIIGGYISFDRGAVESSFPNVDKTMYVGGLHKGVFTVLSPAIRHDNSPATHVLLLEGDPTLIRNTYQQLQEKLGSSTDPNSLRLEVIKLLAKGTQWEKLAESIRTIDRSVFFSHTEDKVRNVNPKLNGLALVGDASGYNNPVFGTGLEHGSNDVERLVKALRGFKDSSELTAAAQYYNYESERANYRRIARTQGTYRAIKAVGFARGAVGRLSRTFKNLIPGKLSSEVD